VVPVAGDFIDVLRLNRLVKEVRPVKVLPHRFMGQESLFKKLPPERRRLIDATSMRSVMKTVLRIVSLPAVKKIIALLIVLTIFSGAAFAQSSSGSGDLLGLKGPVETILGIFTSSITRGIALIFFIILCIGLITTGRQEPEMFKKFIPWIAGTVLFMAAGTITKTFISDPASVKASILE
jgi:type IV secretory pathway VirB2 component (pilin)